MPASTSSAAAGQPISGGWRARLIAVVAGVLGAAAVWVVEVPILGVDLTTTRGGNSTKETTVGIAAVIVTSLLAGLAAWGLLALLERFTSRAGTAWTAVAVVFWLLSFLGPVSAGTSGGVKVSLLLMHLVVGGVLIVLLRRSIKPSGGQS